MAGSYPDNPSRRMAYDEDATVVIGGTATGESTSPIVPPGFPYVALTQQEMHDINDEDHDSNYGGEAGSNGTWFVTMLFPEQREIDGILHITDDENTSPFHTAAKSENTTNGFDGTWVDLALTDLHDITWVQDFYRENIESQAESNVIGLMFKVRQNIRPRHRMIHIFGTQTGSGTPDRLLFLDPDNSDNEFTKPLDFGDVPRGQTQTDTFTLKNNSSTVTADSVQVTGEDLYLGSGAWYTFSDDDIVYSATLNIGNLGIGATQLIHVRQIVPDAQAIGTYVARVKANQASWS